jgi:uncharacterized membrane protein
LIFVFFVIQLYQSAPVDTGLAGSEMGFLATVLAVAALLVLLLVVIIRRRRFNHRSHQVHNKQALVTVSCLCYSVAHGLIN